MSGNTTQRPTERILNTIKSGGTIRVIDLFCGAGGMSWGLASALEEIADALDVEVEDFAELHAVNHWDVAIETHQRQHPWANHYNKPIQQLNPRDIVDEGETIHLLIACPDCTYFSTARGGGPKDRDKRMTPREVLDWVERLSVENILFENVPKFEDWGPLDEDGCPIADKEGEYFENWINALTIEGFNVDWRVLTAADYGDATSRKRLFVAGRQNTGIDWPEQTHSEDGAVAGTKPWRTAADILDWDDPGESLWIRDLFDGRRKPLVNNTMKRIAEGISRHCTETLEPYVDVLRNIGRDEVYSLRDEVVSARYAPRVADMIDAPFLVRYRPSPTLQSGAHSIEQTGGRPSHTLCLSDHMRVGSGGQMPGEIDELAGIASSTFLLRQHNGDGAYPIDVTERPAPTVATAGAISRVDAEPFILPKNGFQRGLFSNKSYEPTDRPLHTVIASDPRQGYRVTPYLVPFYSEQSTQRPRVHSLDEPCPTVTASKVPCGICEPFLIEYYGNGQAVSLDKSLPTQTTKDRFALVIPEMYPLGLDIKFRMLKPSELAAAQGFPEGYDFAGTKTETVKQIGNAVPVNTAQQLCRQMLIGNQPTLDTYLGVNSNQSSPSSATV